jgi:AmmeMemoRadiSam system protein B/AmmeMemoRadiSam system protein A
MAKHRFLILVVLFLLLVSLTCREKERSIRAGPVEKPVILPIQTEKPNIRPPALAGTWYKGEPTALKKDIEGYLTKVPQKLVREFQSQKIHAIITPHAGHTYSGQGAAYLYALLQNRTIKRVILIGPSHYASYRGVAVSQFTHYQTPLGKVPLDREACRQLLANGGLFRNELEAEKREHSLEIQLPFLQTVLKDFKLVPLIVGRISHFDYDAIAKALKKFIDDETLIIASSDFTHYGKNFRYTPFKKDVRANIEKTDRAALQHALNLNANRFVNQVEENNLTICGYRPIALMLSLLPADTRGRLLHYYTSGDADQDYSHSVSYASVVFTADDKLNRAEEQTLLKLARATLRTYLKDRTKPDLKNYDLTPRLKNKSGIFVTLKKNGRLRGCIGLIFDPQPLAESTIEYTIHSAVHDSRFRPVRLAEEPDLHIEISVLSPMRQVKGYQAIVVGTHGVYIVKGRRSAVFLPQVAPEQRWDRDEMLSQLSMKAGLSKDAWKQPGMQFFVFTAHVFGE